MNKALYKFAEFVYPATLTCIHMAWCWLGGWVVLRVLKLRETVHFETGDLVSVVLVSCSYLRQPSAVLQPPPPTRSHVSFFRPAFMRLSPLAGMPWLHGKCAILHRPLCTITALATFNLLLVPNNGTTEQVRRIAPLAAVFTINIILGNVSLLFIPVSFMQTVKSSVPAFTVLLQVFVLV